MDNSKFEPKEIKSIFDRLHLIKAIPFELFFLGFGAFIFFIGEAFILFFEEPHFLVPQITLCSMIGFAPLLLKVAHDKFKTVINNLNVLFGMDQDLWKKWIHEEEINIFTLHHRFSKMIVGLIMLFVIYTIFFVPMPFNTLYLKVFSITALLVLTTFCSITLQFTIMLLLFLRKLTFLNTVARFYLFPHPELTKLQRYYSSLSIVISMGYVALVFSVWFGPYGFDTPALLWLSFLALYPITLFIWSYFHIHLIQHNIKFSFISLINEQVNDSLMVTLQAKDSSNIEKLDKFMTIQSKLHALKEYPFELSGFLTFLATTIITVIQIYLALKKH